MKEPRERLLGPLFLARDRARKPPEVSGGELAGESQPPVKTIDPKEKFESPQPTPPIDRKPGEPDPSGTLARLKEAKERARRQAE